MLTIRFARVGKTNRAQYKIVLQDKTVAPGGRHVEILGSYDPHSKQAVLKEERIKNWISKGAQLSDSVHNLFVTKKIITDKKRTVKLPEIKTQNNTEEKQNDTELKAQNNTEEVQNDTEIKKEDVKVEEAPKEEVKAE